MGRKRNKGQGKSAPVRYEIVRAPKVEQPQKKTENKRFQRHFRKFHSAKTTGHPQYVYEESGKVYLTIGITSHETTNGEQNIPLSKNPEPNNNKPAYMRPTTSSIKKGTKNKKLPTWKLAKADKAKAQEIIDKSKSKK